MYYETMKKPLFTAFFSILLVLLIGCSKSIEPENSDPNQTNTVDFTTINWVGTDLIYSNSQDKKELSLLYFTDDSCADGLLMDFYTFTDSAVIVALNQSYNAARISTTVDTMIAFYDLSKTGNQLFTSYNLVGVPSFLILDSDNRYFGRIQADYYPTDSFLVLLDYYVNKER